MCLGTRMPPKKLKRYIKSLKTRADGYVRLWKVFQFNKNDELSGAHQNYDFYEGKNTADTKKSIECMYNYTHYRAGFHCFTTKKAAELFTRRWYSDAGNETIVPVKVQKTWITAAGRDHVEGCVVCKHIII